jgi:hypothetical protein
VHPGGRCQKTIDRGQVERSIKPPPLQSDGTVHRKDAAVVLSFESRGPSIQRAGGSFIAAPDGFDAAADLADHEDAEPKGSSVDGLVPSPNICVGTFLFADLGDDVRVEKPSAHRSTFRRLVRGRSKSSSAPTSGIASRVALSEREPSRRSERTRISRCSASAERLCAAACRLSETTTSSGRFRTMSCAIDINDSMAARGDLAVVSASPATRRAEVRPAIADALEDATEAPD